MFGSLGVSQLRHSDMRSSYREPVKAFHPGEIDYLRLGDFKRAVKKRL